MNINERLYVEIHPLQSGQIPHPHPITEAHFDPAYVYKVLGMYNPSETSECYMVLVNPQRQIWFISQRHLLAYALIDSDEFFIPIHRATKIGREVRHDFVQNNPDSLPLEKNSEANGRWQSHRLEQKQDP